MCVNKTNFYRPLIYLLVCFLLCACGFRQQNRDLLPPQLSNINIQSNNPYSELETALKQNLQTMGVNIYANAPVVLQINSSTFTHDNPNMVSSSNATVYNFTYNAVFSLTDKRGKQITQPQTVATTKTATLKPNEVLGASNEVAIIQQEMQREIILQIINRLSANNTRKALSTYYKATRVDRKK